MPELYKSRAWKENTATVAELIEALQSYPPDMAVAYTWEGQICPVKTARMEVFEETERIYGPVLLLDAET